MRIDVHAHYWTDDYLDLLVGAWQDRHGHVSAGWAPVTAPALEARLRLMDRAGVEMQVLSASPQLASRRRSDRRQ